MLRWINQIDYLYGETKKLYEIGNAIVKVGRGPPSVKV